MAVVTSTALAVAAIAASAAGTAASMSAQQSAAKKAAKAQEAQGTATASEQRINAALTEIDAERVEKSAGIEAEKIREAAIAMRGQQESIQAVSGALVGSGSNAIMTEDTTKRAEADALATVIEGVYGSVNKQATARYLDEAGLGTSRSAASSANASILAGNAGSAVSLANGVSNMLSTYKSFNT